MENQQPTPSTPAPNTAPTPVQPAAPIDSIPTPQQTIISPPPSTPGNSKTKKLLLIILGVLIAVAIAVGAYLIVTGDNEDTTKQSAEDTNITDSPALKTIIIPGLDLKQQLPNTSEIDIDYVIEYHSGSPGGEEAWSDKDFYTLKPRSLGLGLLDASCGWRDQSLGLIIRVEPGSRIYLNRAEPGEGDPAESLKKIGDHYYTFFPAQFRCSTTDASLAVELKLREALKKGFDTLAITSPVVAKDGVLTVSELGVQIPAEGIIADLSYYAVEPDRIVISSKSFLDDVDQLLDKRDRIYCHSTGLGELIVAEENDRTFKTVEAKGKYISFIPNSSMCADNEMLREKAGLLEDALDEAVRESMKATE